MWFKLILWILNLQFLVIHCQNIEKNYGTRYVLQEMFRFTNHTNIECQKDINIILRGINNFNLWTLKVLESSATFPSNFIYGNNLLIGSQRECNEISNPRSMTIVLQDYIKKNAFLSYRPENITPEYRLAQMNISSKVQVNLDFFRPNTLYLGLCLPITCNETDIKKMVEEYFGDNTTSLVDMYGIEAYDLEIRDLKLSEDYSSKFSVILFWSIIAITMFLTFVSKYSKVLPENLPLMKKFLDSFSMNKNWNEIFHAPSPKFPVISGLKLFCSVQILQFHTQYFGLYRIVSKWYTLIDAENLSSQIVTNGIVFVDVFFVISGFLLMNKYISNENYYKRLQEGPLRKIDFVLSNLLKRMSRILPICVIIMILTDVIASYLRDTSILQLYEKDDYNCQNYWWRNLLFIQNFYPNYDMCMNWSWTLALDMQCYLICTIVYVIYCSNKLIGKLMFGATMTFFTSSMTYQLCKHNYVPTLDKLFTTLDDVYYSTFSRAIPYFIGGAVGYFYATGTLKGITKRAAKYLWIITYITVILCVWGIYFKSDHVWIWIPFLVIGRILFSIVVSWIIIAQNLGHGNRATKILSHPILDHFGKIAYAYYMFNPVLIIYSYGVSKFTMNTDFMTNYMYTNGIIFVNYSSAIICTLIFEIPYLRLMNKKRQ